MSQVKLLLFFLTIVGISSCSKKDDAKPNVTNTFTNKAIAEKTDVKTFEIISLQTSLIPSEKYIGTFGGAPVELLKTSDSTLTFFVPDVSVGEQLLDFELAKIKFSVTKTQEKNADQLVTSLFQNFDLQVSQLSLAEEERGKLDSLNAYKLEVQSLFNSLSAEQKRQTVLFYEANKSVFKSTLTEVFTNLDGSTTFRLQAQSDCPRIDFKSFYGCTAENLGNSAKSLRNASKEFLRMLATAGIMAGVAANTSVLGPAAWGITAVGISLPLGMAGYLLLAEVGPAFLKFRSASGAFLGANWIFTKALFLSTVEVFKDDENTSLNLKSTFRSITSNDSDVSYGSGYFIGSMASLSVYWNKLSSFFGRFPAYKSNEESTTLVTNEILVSNVSNPFVKLINQSGDQVKFKSLSGKEESFNYKIKVSKQGFVEEKELQGKVLAPVDSMPIYKAAVVGNWTMTWNNGEINKYTFNEDGTGIYYWMKCSSCSEGANIDPGNAVYRVTWRVEKIANGVWFLRYDNPDRGWSTSVRLFLTPQPHCGVPNPDAGLWILGDKN